MRNLVTTNTKSQNKHLSNTSDHYEVDNNMQLEFNEERAEFFRVDIKDLSKMLNNSLEEKDTLILKLMQENQMLREDNEVFRTLAMKQQCQLYKLEKKAKASNS